MKAHISRSPKSSPAPGQSKVKPPNLTLSGKIERPEEKVDIQRYQGINSLVMPTSFPTEPPPSLPENPLIQAKDTSPVPGEGFNLLPAEQRLTPVQPKPINQETIPEAEKRLQRNSSLSREERQGFQERLRSSILARHEQEMGGGVNNFSNSFQQPSLGPNLVQQQKEESSQNQDQPEVQGEPQAKSITQFPQKENKSPEQVNKVSGENPKSQAIQQTQENQTTSLPSIGNKTDTKAKLQEEQDELKAKKIGSKASQKTDLSQLPKPQNQEQPTEVKQPQTQQEKVTKQKPVEENTQGSVTPQAVSTSPQSSAGSSVNIPQGGGGAVAEVDEVAEVQAMEQRLAEVAPEEEQGNGQLSPAEKEVALTSLAADPAPAIPVSGGGGSGAAIEEKTTPEAPDVSQAEPKAALGQIAALPPAKLMTALGGLGAAVGKTVREQRAELAANPPEMETPSGKEKPAATKEVAKGEKPKPVEKKPEAQEIPTPQPEPLPPEKTPPKVTAAPPKVQGNEEGKLSESDAANIKASIGHLPTHDSGAKVMNPGPAPNLKLEGNADPQQAQEQKAELAKSAAEAKAKGQQDIAQPRGEQEIYSNLPQETLKAEIGGGGATAAGAMAPLPALGEGGGEAVSLIAQQEKGGEIQAAVVNAQGEMALKQQEHKTKVAEEKAQNQQQIEQLKQENFAQQEAERSKTQGEVQKLRGEWSQEQEKLVSQSQVDADQAIGEGMEKVNQEKAQAEEKANQEIQKGEEKAEQERQKGEQSAAKEKEKGEEKSGGIFGWLADKAKSFFDGIKQAVQKAFEVARAAMRAAIEGAKKLATAAIELGRKAIVGIIKGIGAALIAIGDKLLAAFPEVRDRFRKAIEDKVQQAEAAVNKLAEGLKTGIKAALDLLVKGLDAALGLLEKGMLAVVDGLGTMVSGALKFAEGAMQAFGAFAVLVKDVAANPMQWLSNLGAGASDGIRNHFWGAFKEQTQTWFNQKLEGILGLGGAIWGLLTKGGINIAQVGKMAWNAAKQALPSILIGILIEKLVSMIVPAAGAILTIIQGLQAAWGTVGSILQAFNRFIAFLKAVKGGNSGPQFGSMLAAGGVVLLDFVASFLLIKLGKVLKKLAGKLKGIAKGLAKKFKGKKGKKNKDNKDKKNNKGGNKKLRPIAQQAAQKGWKKAKKLTKKQVQPESLVKSQLSQTPVKKSGASVKTTLLTQGSTWMVESVATKQGKTAKANAGKGWVAKDTGGKNYYAGINNSSLHKKILKETATKLNQTNKGNTKDGNGDLQSAYNQKVNLAKQLEQKGQQKIDKRIKGIKFSVELEAYEGVKTDKKIATKMTISPNVEELETNIILDDRDNNFNDLAQAIQRSTGLRKTYKVVDEIDRLVDAIVKRVNANRSSPDKKIVTTLQMVDDTVIGGTSHKFMFKMKKHTGKPAFLIVERLSGNTDCASCEVNSGQSAPHNVVTAAHAKNAIDEALIRLLGTTNFTASVGSKLHTHMRGIAESTSKGAALPTKGEYQKQCSVCEGSAPGDTDGKYLAAQSLQQRAGGATAPGGATALSRGMDEQFQTTTPTARRDITHKRIENLISKLEREVQLATHTSGTPIDVLRTDPVKRNEFLTLLRRLLRKKVK